ncbi:MAG: glycosyltransferase family 2 protein, partial [Cyanobacteria bacterium P01_D01_bin.36]
KQHSTGQSAKLPSLTAPAISRSVTVVVCARNEAANLAPLFNAIESAFQSLGFELPVLLIDDGSSDDTPATLEQLQPNYPFLTVIRHAPGKGLTQCLKTAITHTDTDWLYFSPADLESDPTTDLPCLLNNCSGEVDAIAGWRQARKDGKTLASTVANQTCNLLFGLNIHDMNWIKLVRRDVLTQLPIEKTSHAYILPIMAALGYHITEVPTAWHARQEGKSKFNSSRLLSSAIKFWRLWWWFYIVEKGRPISKTAN